MPPGVLVWFDCIHREEGLVRDLEEEEEKKKKKKKQRERQKKKKKPSATRIRGLCLILIP